MGIPGGKNVLQGTEMVDAIINGLVEGKIYRKKTISKMRKSMVSG